MAVISPQVSLSPNMLGHKSANITLKVYAKYTKYDKKVRGIFLLDS